MIDCASAWEVQFHHWPVVFDVIVIPWDISLLLVLCHLELWVCQVVCNLGHLRVNSGREWGEGQEITQDIRWFRPRLCEQVQLQCYCFTNCLLSHTVFNAFCPLVFQSNCINTVLQSTHFIGSTLDEFPPPHTNWIFPSNQPEFEGPVWMRLNSSITSTTLSNKDDAMTFLTLI